MYGYEVVPQAISDARRNAVNNGISNATFVQGDLNKISDNFGDQFPKPDIVISGYLVVLYDFARVYNSFAPYIYCKTLDAFTPYCNVTLHKLLQILIVLACT